MKKQIIAILKRAGLYHFLQSGYRSTLNGIQKNYNRLAYAKYRGSGFVCNFCGSVYQRFVPEYPAPGISAALHRHQVIAGYGNNVYCPNCMSKNRERLIRGVLQDQLDLQGKKILHCSPEPALHRFLIKGNDIATVDLEPGFYLPIEKNIQFADVTALQFEDDSFDLVVANHILEHIPEDLDAIKEFYRVIKKGGLAILQVPYSEILQATIEDKGINDPHLQEKLFGQKDHVRIYALSDYLDRVQSCGFRVKVFAPDSLSVYRKYAIQENESVFFFYK